MAIKLNRVANNTMGNEMPSIPKANEVPKRVFQGIILLNCMALVLVSKARIKLTA